jgi:hypothetical protein
MHMLLINIEFFEHLSNCQLFYEESVRVTLHVKANEHNKYGSDRKGDKNRKDNSTMLCSQVRHAGNMQHVCCCHHRWTLLPTTKKKLVTDMF